MSITATPGITAQGTLTQTGAFHTARGASGTFTRTVTDQNGVRTADTVFTLPGGRTVTHDNTLTRTATGYTDSASTIFANGETASTTTTGTRTAPGSFAITGTHTTRGGATDALTGTRSFGAGTRSTDLTLTNAAGQTATLDSQALVTGNHIASTITGTTFNGAAFTGHDALTLLQTQPTGS